MKLRTILATVLAAFVCQGCSTSQPQATFATPDAAVQSLVAASKANDEAQLKQLFGPDSTDLVGSGDPVADANNREKFVAAYEAKHTLAANPDGSLTLDVGNSDWPLPIPLVKSASTGKWSFDTAAGKDELINRRIGNNELNVIKVCEATTDAQREYAERDPDGDGIPEYALKFISDEGKKNGLYWPTAEGEPPSPLGPLVGEAVDEGYSATPGGAPRPYHGYFFKMLTAQGPSAPGGAMSYIVKGKFIGGFGVVAWPAQYGSSGIMTFIVGYDGVVYQKDLGPETAKRAKAMTAYDPGDGWKPAE